MDIQKQQKVDTYAGDSQEEIYPNGLFRWMNKKNDSQQVQ